MNCLQIKAITVLLLLVNILAIQATLVSNVSVACPGDVVTFTCTMSGNILRWTVNPPPGSGYTLVNADVSDRTNINDPLIVGSDSRFQFERIRIEASQGQLRSTLSTLSSISISTYNESTVNCEGQELKIQVAAPPTPPQNPMLTFENQTSVSVATLQWSPPTYTGGVDVSYVLTISSPTLPESSYTTASSSIEVTVTYNIEYNITIRANNCAGSSQDVVMVFKLVVCPSSPSTANGVVLTNISSVTTEGSTLTITCSNNNDIVPSTCGTDARWSPDPGDYDCMLPVTAPPIMCGPLLSPVNGSVNLMSTSVTYAEGSVLTFQCDDGLFPSDARTTTCRDVSGRGEWDSNPAHLVCRVSPINCSVPGEPVNGSILDYENINTIEGSIIFVKCDEGLSPLYTTARCTNGGVWDPDPGALECVTTGGQDATTIIIAVSAVFGLLFILIAVILIIITIVVILQMRRGKNVSNNGEHVEMCLPANFENKDTLEPTLEGTYSELRHHVPKTGSTKKPQPVAGIDEYDKIVHNKETSARLAYDNVIVGSMKNDSTEYSTLNSGQKSHAEPGYSQLNSGVNLMATTADSVQYADVGSYLKTPVTECYMDQHKVLYSMVDIKATKKKAADILAKAHPADKLLNLDQALVQLRAVHHNWKLIGQALQVPVTYIEQIEEACAPDDNSRMAEIIEYWMRNCSGVPTWRELADGLKQTGEYQLAQQLMGIYETGRLPVEVDMDKVSKDVYKYDNAPPPPLPTRSPTRREADISPRTPKILPHLPPELATTDVRPCRPPKTASLNEPTVPIRPPKRMH